VFVDLLQRTLYKPMNLKSSIAHAHRESFNFINIFEILQRIAYIISHDLLGRKENQYVLVSRKVCRLW